MAIQHFLAIAVLAAFVASLYGWGRTAARLSGEADVPWGYATALGVAVWFFFGGILTALHAVLPRALKSNLREVLTALRADWLDVPYLIFCLGLLLSCYVLWMRARAVRAPRPDFLAGDEAAHAATPLGQRLWQIGCYACLAVVLIFLSLTMLPVRSFHIHDDMMLYLPRVMRIVQTGAVDDLFDPIGLDSLGGLPFLQASIASLGTLPYWQEFVSPHFPITYIYGCDSVLCYLLCAVLVLELARELALSWGHALLAMLLFLGIRIDEHNASPVYSGSLMILLAMLATCRLAKSAPEGGQTHFRAAIPVGLALAGMSTLKLSMAFFAGLYFLILLAGLILSSRKDRQRVELALAIGLVALLATAPWIAAYTGKYVMMLRAYPYATRSPNPTQSAYATGMANLWAMFSWQRYRGVASLCDNLMLVALTAAALAVAIVGFRRAGRPASWSRLACAAACGAFLISFVFWQFCGFDAGNNMRYLGPLPAAVLPAAALIIVAAAGGPARPAEPAPSRSRAAWGLGVAVLQVAVIALFGRVTVERTLDAWRLPNYIGDQSPTRMLAIQQAALPDQRILAWVKTPQYFDFTRNEMFLVYQSGLLSPWLDFPPAVERLRLLAEKSVQAELKLSPDQAAKIDAVARKWQSLNLPVYLAQDTEAIRLLTQKQIQRFERIVERQRAARADEFFRRYGIRFLLRERMEPTFPSGDNDINGMAQSRMAVFHKMGSRFVMLKEMYTVAERHHKVVYDDGRIVLTDLAQ